MRFTRGRRWTWLFEIAAVMACLGLARAHAQEQDLQPEKAPSFGSAALKEGFQPDPFKKNLVAGGKMQKKIGKISFTPSLAAFSSATWRAWIRMKSA